MITTAEIDAFFTGRKETWVNISTPGQIHVYPVSYFRGIANGEPGLDPLPLDVQRAIIREWLNNLPKPQQA